MILWEDSDIHIVVDLIDTFIGHLTDDYELGPNEKSVLLVDWIIDHASEYNILNLENIKSIIASQYRICR